MRCDSLTGTKLLLETSLVGPFCCGARLYDRSMQAMYGHDCLMRWILYFVGTGIGQLRLVRPNHVNLDEASVRSKLLGTLLIVGMCNRRGVIKK